MTTNENQSFNEELKLENSDYAMNIEFNKETPLKNWSKAESTATTKGFRKKNVVRPKTGKVKEDVEKDFALALDLVNKYKKNKNWINEEIREENRRLELIEETSKPPVKAPSVDPILSIEMRHALIDQKRKQREKEKIERAAKPLSIPMSKGKNVVVINPPKNNSVQSKVISDPILMKQIREINNKRVAIEHDNRMIAEEVKEINIAVKLQTEVIHHSSLGIKAIG